MTRHILSIGGKSTRGPGGGDRCSPPLFHLLTPLFIDITVGALTTPRVVYWLSHEGTTIKLDRALKYTRWRPAATRYCLL